MGDIRTSLRNVIDGHGETHIARKRHRMSFLFISGTLLMVLVFILML